MLALTHYASFMVPFSILAYIIAIIVIVFIHELGHFMVGRWCGVNIDAFSIGFGPEIWGFNDRHGKGINLHAAPTAHREVTEFVNKHDYDDGNNVGQNGKRHHE